MSQQIHKSSDEAALFPAEFVYRSKATLYTMTIARLGANRERRVTIQEFASSKALTEYMRGSRMKKAKTYAEFYYQ